MTQIIKTYILQKDLPDIKAGAKFKPVSALAYGYIRSPHYHIEYANHFVENNPEWFLPEEQPMYTRSQLIHHIKESRFYENADAYIKIFIQ